MLSPLQCASRYWDMSGVSLLEKFASARGKEKAASYTIRGPLAVPLWHGSRDRTASQFGERGFLAAQPARLDATDERDVWLRRVEHGVSREMVLGG